MMQHYGIPSTVGFQHYANLDAWAVPVSLPQFSLISRDRSLVELIESDGGCWKRWRPAMPRKDRQARMDWGRPDSQPRLSDSLRILEKKKFAFVSQPLQTVWADKKIIIWQGAYGLVLASAVREA